MKTAHEMVMQAKEMIREVSLEQAQKAIAGADLLIDVREPAEFAAGHLQGALNIPRGMLEFSLDSQDRLKDRGLAIVVYCKTSGRAALSAFVMSQMGYSNVQSIAGGYEAWLAAGHPVVQPEHPKFD
jgi:rhodanese-related sulfurtransferase